MIYVVVIGLVACGFIPLLIGKGAKHLGCNVPKPSEESTPQPTVLPNPRIKPRR